MSRIDASDPAIASALTDVKNANSGTNWVLLGYVPKSDNKLKVVETGSGGLSELSDHWNDGKVLFALVGFEINKTRKFAYISWCGEGVIGMKKGLFNNHANDVALLFKGFHVQINARHEDDVSEKIIVDKLKKSIGASYDSGAKHQGTAEAVPTTVAQGRQQATQSNVSRNVLDKNDYNKKSESADFWQKHREEEEREKQQRSVSKPISSDYNKTGERQQFWAQQQQQSTSQGSRPSAQPAAPSGNASALRSRFENANTQTEQPKPAPAPVRSGPVRPVVSPPPPEPEPEPEPEPAGQSNEEYYDDQQQQQQSYDDQQQSYDDQQQSYDDQEQQQQQQSYDDQQQYYDDQQQQSYDDQQQYYDDQQSNEAPAGSGPQARALYDYDAENPDDLSFRENDVINILDQSDPSGWWKGELNGISGFFPSNFVELI